MVGGWEEVLRGGEEIPFASLGPPLRGYQTIPAPAVQVCGPLALSSPSRSPTYPFSAQRLAAFASRQPQGAERQQTVEWAVRFYVIFWQL